MLTWSTLHVPAASICWIVVDSFFCCVWIIYVLEQVSEEVHRKCHPRNTTGQLSTPYTDPECHNTQRHRQTDGQTTLSCQLAVNRPVSSACMLKARNVCVFIHVAVSTVVVGSESVSDERWHHLYCFMWRYDILPAAEAGLLLLLLSLL